MTDDFSLDADEFRCLVPFPDETPSFVHGFEAGCIWERMNKGEQQIGGIYEIALHTKNIEVFNRMAAAQGYDIEIEPPGVHPSDNPVWSIVTFTKRRNRFRVV